jgi:hypothetical protein
VSVNIPTAALNIETGPVVKAGIHVGFASRRSGVQVPAGPSTSHMKRITDYPLSISTFLYKNSIFIFDHLMLLNSIQLKQYTL